MTDTLTKDSRCGDAITWKGQQIICNLPSGHDGDHVSGLSSWARGTAFPLRAEQLSSNEHVQFLREFLTRISSGQSHVRNGLEGAAAEIERLTRELENAVHDIGRLVATTAELATDNERLQRERDEAQERFEDMRDVVYHTANVERDQLRAALEAILDHKVDYSYKWVAKIARAALDGGAVETNDG